MRFRIFFPFQHLTAELCRLIVVKPLKMRFHAAAGERLPEIEIGVDGAVVSSVLPVVAVGIVRVEPIASSHLVNMPEGGDVIYLDDLKVTQTLNKDEYIIFPYRKVASEESSVLQAIVETPGSAAGDFYSYTVNGYFPISIDPVYGDEILYGEESNEIYVNAPDAVKAIDADKAAKAYFAGDELRIENPAGEPVYIYTVGGAIIKADVTGSAVVTSRLTQKGVYIVRVGNQAAKVVR